MLHWNLGSHVPIESTIPFPDLSECLQIATNKNGEAIMGVPYSKNSSHSTLITGIDDVK